MNENQIMSANATMNTETVVCNAEFTVKTPDLQVRPDLKIIDGICCELRIELSLILRS